MDPDATFVLRIVALKFVDFRQVGDVIIPGLYDLVSVVWCASKSTTQGGIFDILLYVTFDCAGIAAFRKHRWYVHVQAH